MLFYLSLLFFLLIPIGFGFGLAVYLKRKYENPTSVKHSSAAENVLDILRASSVSQDILLAQNKVPEEENPPTSQASSGLHKLDDFLGENPVSVSQQQETESPPEPQSGFVQNTDKPGDVQAASVIDSPRDLPPCNTIVQETGHSARKDDGNPQLYEQDSLLVQAVNLLSDLMPQPNTGDDPPPTENIMDLVNASSPSHDILLVQNKIPAKEPDTE